MSDKKTARPRARLPRGFRDRGPAEMAAERQMLDTIRGVYDQHGFEALETPAFEFTDALGKFLPDQDRPNEGVFSFKDEDDQWLSLRYDLTAPLARYYAERSFDLPKPFRRYQVGSVWRNEKPGPGRFREFTQFDADTVGSSSPMADAELLVMVADAFEKLGLVDGDYVVKANSRKLLDGVLECAGVPMSDSDADRSRRATVMRAIDKFDRLGTQGVSALLGRGRKDESGDFTSGAELETAQIDKILSFITAEIIPSEQDRLLTGFANLVANSKIGIEGIEELTQIAKFVAASGFGTDRIRIDPGIVRGLEYYTGAVFEGQLTFPVANEAGDTVAFGAVAGGGRYDNLVARFTGKTVPATGISIGVSRLLTALRARQAVAWKTSPLVLVTVFNRDAAERSFKLARELHAAGIRAETFVGDGRLGDQLKYADARKAAFAIIEGPDEHDKGVVTLKDLDLGAEMARDVSTREEWTKGRMAQQTVARGDLVATLKKLLG